MEKFKVSFEANNQQLKSIGTKHASDTYADIEATFVLGEKWTDMDSVSAVWWNDFTRVATVLDSQGKCIVPHEVLTRKGCVRVNLVGSIVEGDELITRLTSYSAEAVQVNEKIKLTGNETSEITPSQYEQFVANVKADADRAEAGATASANSAQNASESATASANSASDSAQSAIASAQSAQNASESAITAENAKDDAEDARDKILGMRATATTLEAGSDATASYSDGLLTLGIPRGDQGIQGIQGETGATPNLTIGAVETLEPTEDATASITGTAEEPILNLGIPKGDTGDVSQEQLDAAVSDLKSDLNRVASIGVCQNKLNPNTASHGFLNSDGSISADNTWSVSDYIPVDIGKWTVKGVTYVGAYDSNKTFKSRFATNTTGAKVYNFVQSEGISFIRLCGTGDPVDWRCNKGDSLIDEEWFADYAILQEDVSIVHQIDSTLTLNEKGADAKVVGDYLKKTGVFESSFKKHNYDVYNSDFVGWYKGQSNSYDGAWNNDNIPTGDGFGWLTTYAHVISKFDALMTLSDGYITKNALGTASGTDGNGNPYTLYEYVLKPKHYSVENSETLTLKVPKLLFTCCQHGFEKNIAYGAYYFINDLVNNWDKSDRLKAIRHFAEIHIIPIVNPWGFDNDSYLNANGVNLNRNYDVPNWIYYPPSDTASSSGTAPFDQPETQIIRDWVSDNDDALMLIDGHTNGHYYTSGYNNMNSLMAYNDTNDWYFNKLFRVFVREIENQTAMFPNMYPSIQPDSGNTATSFCGRTQDGVVRENNRGVIDLWCIKSMNLISFTLETFNGLSVNETTIVEYMSADAKKICSEIIGNCISEIIREYASI